MAFGATGGRGGFGVSFPNRGKAPNSEVVDYLRPQEEWQADWEARRAAEAGRARGPAAVTDPVAQMRSAPTTPADQEPFWGADYTPSTGLGIKASMPNMPTSIDYGVDAGAYAPPVVMDQGYTPDFSALNAEKDQMTQRYDAFQRQNQTYGIMNGGGMLNGVLGEGYSDPNYGLVNTAGGTGIDGQAPTGVNMDWTGVYNPAFGSGAIGQRKKGWGQ